MTRCVSERTPARPHTRRTSKAPLACSHQKVPPLEIDTSDPHTLVIVEVQRHIKREKLLTWPAYVANLRAKLACPAVLLVIAPDPAVAAWARRPIELDQPGFHLAPAIAQLPADQARLYFDVIMMALPAAIRRILEARMQRYEYKSDFARKYYGQGVAEGLEKGLEKGRQEGRENGLRAAVVALARTKLAALSDGEIAAIEALSDPRVLTELVTSLGQASSVLEARATLDRALAR